MYIYVLDNLVSTTLVLHYSILQGTVSTRIHSFVHFPIPMMVPSGCTCESAHHVWRRLSIVSEHTGTCHPPSRSNDSRNDVIPPISCRGTSSTRLCVSDGFEVTLTHLRFLQSESPFADFESTKELMKRTVGSMSAIIAAAPASMSETEGSIPRTRPRPTASRGSPHIPLKASASYI